MSNGEPNRLESRSDVEVNEAPDGLVIYDAATDRVHYLNPTAAPDNPEYRGKRLVAEARRPR